MGFLRTTASIAALVMGLGAAFAAAPAGAESHRLVPATVAPPRGFVDFCNRYPSECRATAQDPQPVALTPARLAQLRRVQTEINRAVSYRPDSYTFGKRDFWEYPFVYGDCEDFALQKRRKLVALGWPRSNLLLTIARQPKGPLHLVLTAVTDAGDLVLDNELEDVVAWNDLDYRWLIRQSRTDESAWVAVAKSAIKSRNGIEAEWSPAGPAQATPD